MPKRIPPLTDLQVKRAKPKDRSYKIADGEGMYLLVTTSGGKLWRLDYRHADKRKTLALGKYPDVSLSQAREKRQKARELLAKGLDPGEVKKAENDEKAERRVNTFEKLALEWHKRQADSLAQKTKQMLLSRLHNDVFPAIGDMPLSDLTPRIILKDILRPIEDRGAIELAHRVRGLISQILRYGVACGKCKRDFTTDLRGALKPIQRKHHAALDNGGTTDPKKVGALLRAIDTYDGYCVVKCALQLHPLVATRPGELRHAEWSEIDLDVATWAIPAGRMKMKNPHIVPLLHRP